MDIINIYMVFLPHPHPHPYPLCIFLCVRLSNQTLSLSALPLCLRVFLSLRPHSHHNHPNMPETTIICDIIVGASPTNRYLIENQVPVSSSFRANPQGNEYMT